MRAIGYQQPGPIDRDDSLVDIEWPNPVPGPGDLLVRVHAIAVNPADVKVRAGIRSIGRDDAQGWRIPGFDTAGEVVAVGDEVRGFAPGDAVFYVGDGKRDGSAAELHLVDARIVARKPETLDWAEAAALPLTASTAWEILFDRIDVARAVPGAAAAVLVVNGAGGVGSAAIQLLRARTDLIVIASASREETVKWVRAMGAHHVVDHRRPLAPQVAALGLGQPGFVLSTSHTADHLADLVELVAPQGRIGAIDDPQTLDIVALKDKSLSFHWEYLLTRSKYDTADLAEQGRILAEIAALVDAGKLRSTLTERLAPIDAANLKRAHALVESGKIYGKVVLDGW